MKQKNFILCIICIAILILPKCKSESSSVVDNGNDTTTVNPNLGLYSSIRSIMKDYYLWYDSLNTVTASDYSTVQDYLTAISYTKRDKWSFIITKAEYESYFVEGNFFGHGVSYSLDKENNIRIAFLYSESGLYQAGVRRGWIVKSINGTAVSASNMSSLLGSNSEAITNSFTFQKPDGSETTITDTKKTLSVNAVLLRDTIHVGNKIVGHIVFQTFIDPAIPEMLEAFKYFKDNNVSELIVDLRYNGGGSMYITGKMANCIAGNFADGKELVEAAYNDKLNEKYGWKTYIEKNDTSLNNIQRIFFITTQETASASEVIINGIRPYIPTYIIGDRTHGKPVGMNVLKLSKYPYVIAPIMFKLKNSAGYGDYFDGLAADVDEWDDITHDFNDKNEACLKQALTYIKTGAFLPVTKRNVFHYNKHNTGFQAVTNAY
jgi:C-terminal processing protease CtpA/Prc